MKGMSLIVKTVTRWVKVFIFLYGVYITVTGHLTPGGGFAGGVIIACSYILLMLAYGREFAQRQLSAGVAARLDSLGALLFLSVALTGLAWGGSFFANVLQARWPGRPFTLLSSGGIPVSNIAICLKVGASLFVVFVVAAVLRIVPDEKGGRKLVRPHIPGEED